MYDSEEGARASQGGAYEFNMRACVCDAEAAAAALLAACASKGAKLLPR